MIKKYLTSAIVAAGLMFGASAASAASMNFGTGNGIAGSNSYSFTDSGVTAVATPLSTYSNSTIHQYSPGLGVTSYRGDSHEVDGYRANEAVRLTFSEEVTITSILFGAVGSNDDFWFRVDGGSFSSERDINGSGDSGYYNFVGLVGTIFDVAAFGDNDDFKVRGVEFTVSSVPLPPAVLMFGAALLGLGWVKRRKQAA